MDASPEVLESMGIAANIHDGLDKTITLDDGKLIVGQGYSSNIFLVYPFGKVLLLQNYSTPSVQSCLLSRHPQPPIRTYPMILWYPMSSGYVLQC